MKLIGNILWWIFGGFVTAMEYFLASLALMVTIVGIPFGIQTFKIGVMTLFPFNSTIKDKSNKNNILSIIMNIIWFCIGGVWIALTHVVFAALLTITIIGIPFAKQHIKLARIAFFPFGKEIVTKY
ncbi:MAG: YccF domain-containing protein [Candidatus Neomarinimicrobiota bacterium]